MTIMPKKRAIDMFDDLLSYPLANTMLTRDASPLMKTDIKEKDNSYVLHVDLPGYQKEDIKVEMDKGYVTVKAIKAEESSKNEDDGAYIHKERYYGECERSFFVGENVNEDEVNAVYKNGTLVLTVPKLKGEKADTQKYIAIK